MAFFRCGWQGVFYNKAVKTAKASIASFVNKTGANLALKGLTCYINPTQSGSGDPYPAGGGKNKFDKSTATENSYINSSGNTSGSNGWAVSDYVKAEENTTYTLSGSGTTGSAAYTGFYNESKGVISTVVNTQTTFTTPVGTAYIRISMLSANIDTTQLELGSTATAYAPYSNIRPITGVSSVNVTRTGKNLLDKSTGVVYSSRYIAFGVDNYTDTIPNGSIYLQAGTYTFSVSGENSTNWETFAVYDETNTRLAISYNRKSYSFTVATAGAFKITIVISSENFVSWDNYDIQLEKNASETAFEAYKGNTYTLDLDGTRYGGTIDIVDGEAIFTIKYVKSIVDKTMLKSYNSSSMVFATSGGKRIVRMRSFLSYTTTGAKEGYYCRAIKWAGEIFCISNIFSNIHINNRGFLASQLWTDFIVPDTVTDYASWQSFIQDLIDNNVDVEFCYEYSTADPGYPTEVQLSPTQINSLLGQNNIWHDGNGDIEAEYYEIAIKEGGN